MKSLGHSWNVTRGGRIHGGSKNEGLFPPKKEGKRTVAGTIDLAESSPGSTFLE